MITYIGDVHGKVESVEKALKLSGRKVFVGDFMDSYDRSIADHEKCLRLVLEAMEPKDGEVRCIYGNHELSYLKPEKHACSGWNPDAKALVMSLRDQIEEHFVPFIWDSDRLITHAGLTAPIWELWKLSKENLAETLSGWWKDITSPAHWIGEARGGRNITGGIFWCDFHNEFQPIEGLAQIFGHTRGQGIRSVRDSHCIDARWGRGNETAG